MSAHDPNDMKSLKDCRNCMIRGAYGDARLIIDLLIRKWASEDKVLIKIDEDRFVECKPPKVDWSKV